MADVSILKISQDQTVDTFQSHVAALLEPLGGMRKFVPQGATVLLKPNICVATSPETGRITHPDFVEAVARLVLDAGASLVQIAESCLAGGDMDAAYTAGGYDRFRDMDGVSLTNLKKTPCRLAEVKDPLAMKAFEIFDPYFTADVVINLPKLKTIASTTVSLSMKNLKGLIRDNHKRQCHYTNLSEAVADLNSCIDVDLNIIEGATGYALHSRVDHGVLLASSDRVALDTVGAMCMGVDPKSVKHICLAAEKGLGEPNPEKIQIHGAKPDAVMKAYPQAQNDTQSFEKLCPEIPVLAGETCSACVAVTEMLLRGLQSELETGWAAKWKSRLVLSVGRDAPEDATKLKDVAGKDTTGKTVLRLGNCRSCSEKEAFIPGCPYLAADALQWLQEHDPDCTS